MSLVDPFLPLWLQGGMGNTRHEDGTKYPGDSVEEASIYLESGYSHKGMAIVQRHKGSLIFLCELLRDLIKAGVPERVSGEIADIIVSDWLSPSGAGIPLVLHTRLERNQQAIQLIQNAVERRENSTLLHAIDTYLQSPEGTKEYEEFPLRR